MEDSGLVLAGLIVSIGSFVASAAAAAVAWWKAIDAGRDKADAETARDDAVTAQQAASEALSEANKIASEARDMLRARESRETERHSVEWVPHWEWETGKWYLGNHGPDTAHKVRLSVESHTVGRVLQEEDAVATGQGLVVDFPAYVAQGGAPGVKWRVDWETAAGSPREDDGFWTP